MCWYVNFEVSLIDKRGQTEIEQMILGQEIKSSKKGLDMVRLVTGSMGQGFRTALHCDCDNILTDEETKKQRLLHYPELFERIIQEDKVKNIRVWWFWGKDEKERKEKKLTIREFLAMNDNYELNDEFNYRILKERYV